MSTVYEFAKASLTGTKLFDEIVATGLPIDGTGITAIALAGGNVRIRFQRALDAGEQTTVANLVTAHVAKPPRKGKTVAVLSAEIQALSAADRNKLLVGIAAEFLGRRRAFARSLGIAIDGDEIA